MLSEILTEVGSLWIVFVAAVVSIVAAFYIKKGVDKADPGNEQMVIVQGYIKNGADAFIKRQYTTLAYFVAGLSVLVGITYSYDAPTEYIPQVPGWLMVISYILGSVASGWAGWLGMKVGVDANAKTAAAANKEDRDLGMNDAFNVSFYAGCVMGLLVTGAALGGVWALYYFTSNPRVVLGFSFGASSIALFAKAGGGIYTKTADVAADIVGKIEQSLPEDDPRNPAAVADNVGDNVGDIAGMGADLFDSYVASLIATMLLGLNIYGEHTFSAFPLIISAAGLFASLIGIYLIVNAKKEDPNDALNRGTYLATGLFIGTAAIVTVIVQFTSPDAVSATRLWKTYGAAVFGVLCGLVIGITTDYYTDDRKKPTQAIAESSEQGHALNILTGFSYGLMSIGPPVIGIAIAMGVAYALDGVYGVAMASVGMLAIVGTIVSNDAYGPVVDNARGIAEQGGLDEEVIAVCDRLDSAGNTAKAITKGFAIGAAALTVLALLYSFVQSGHEIIPDDEVISLDIQQPGIMIGLILGVAVPCIYSAILIFSVDKNAQIMVKEIRRQFEEEPGILKGEVAADFERCIDIATKGSLKALVIPSLLSIGAPLLVGLFMGIPGLSAFLAGSILSGFVFALLMSNAGGAWDNAKKYIEDGHLGGKGTLAHAASITGDTVGDPFKDTAGPAINTLICVMSLTAEMFITLFGLMPHSGLGFF